MQHMRLSGMPDTTPRHREEMLRLAASGFQLLALALIGGALIAPLFNPAIGAPWSTTLSAAVAGGLSEGAAFLALLYIPFNAAPAAS
jgi:hypothetical protein